MNTRLREWARKNAANVVTVAGLISASIFLALALIQPNEHQKQLFWATVAAVSDFCDGRIARKFNAVSVFGSYMDRIKDHLLIFPGIVILLFFHWDKVWVPEILIGFVATLIFFEIKIARVGLIGYRWYIRGKKIGEKLQPDNAGKKKIFTGYMVVLLWLISLSFPKIAPFFWAIIYFGLSLMAYWSHISISEYSERERNTRLNTAPH
ncbi:MAG: hypothetical protein A2365_03790 [Candidatus Nealsonbacteria bacterium RIFOXYB1_FULL_40_15]|uniref:CDP-diacylglycerol--glycerol-3-phosphate 3-phosphatidyltransferase n=2 Tax=Candidatus Nealsoniibacteriota TaxID=1817911 RepID=A0A1G2EM39_9BACT|nr:MAG: hypothetical protein A2427_00930 [Candidatus Nealsonbacteria bacterium RIFOXYC1_FULL_40_7]OGZ27736.1 MAG: hypothetical protein A2365_03790 [Candidatus Nealsonbacteria bacterium RIFOXYB1_FULL_40_15]OGZ29547.1 MAG: hypothetical protein A2562_02560 [Candidatus Nealsonbacteria bacterium RIFOXYD1_FULL_39_11]